ncbi:MAG: transposase [Gammaproteobacteria bacterium]|nr:transposase [Gammaproteobacteria bacterium]MCF6364104.1 transposase [Gammaproteobacteria bacterium]
MSNYRRANTAGGTYFFTVVSYRRQEILCDERVRSALREGIDRTRQKYPFEINAWVLLPDHLHCLWTLPKGDANFPVRWAKIKRHVSLVCGDCYKRSAWLSDSRKKHRESTLWQRRYWEHQIRDESDFNRHVEYIHYNPVKHGLCEQPIQWPHSTLHRYVREEKYPADWAMKDSSFDGPGFGE